MGISTLSSVKGGAVAKHKKHKWVRRPQVEEVFDLLDRGKKVLTVAQETGICRSKVYELRQEKLARDAIQAKRQPSNPIQEEVFSRCPLDHDWMKYDRYEGTAFLKKTGHEIIRAPEGPEWRPGWRRIWEERICWFCGYQQRTERNIPPGVAGVFPR